MKYTHKFVQEVEILAKGEDFKYCVWLKEGYINTREETTMWHCDTIAEIKEFMQNVKKI